MQELKSGQLVRMEDLVHQIRLCFNAEYEYGTSPSLYLYQQTVLYFEFN